MNPRMDNTTALTFTMTAYAAIEKYKHGLFVVFLLLYLITVTLNSLLIAVIYQNKDLHQPMNVFICTLLINEIYGSSVLLPTIMSVLLSETYELSVNWCKAQVYFMHTYGSAEFSILAVMGYDRYVAICYPLHYHSIMSNSKIYKLVALAVLYPTIAFGSFYSLTLQLNFCGKTIPKLYCVNFELVKNSCSYPPYISIVGLVLILVLVAPHVLFVIFSYAQISRVCRKLSKESKHNALKTCIPHLLSLTNYTLGALFEIIQSRFNMSHLPAELQIFLSLYFIVTPPVCNPVLYGLGTQIIRVHILKLFVRCKILPTKLFRYS